MICSLQEYEEKKDEILDEIIKVRLLIEDKLKNVKNVTKICNDDNFGICLFR